MSEFLLQKDLDAIEQRTLEIDFVNRRANELEAQAAALRLHAAEARTNAFQSAGASILENLQNNQISDTQAVAALAYLGDKDPELVKLYGNNRSDTIVEAFAKLQPNEPIVGLPDDKQQKMTGIITGEPHVTEINLRDVSKSRSVYQPFMAPWGKLMVPAKVIDRNGQVQSVEITTDISVLATSTIGRVALQQLTDGAEFTIGHDSSLCRHDSKTNALQLQELRTRVNELQTLGLEPLDTTNLDIAITKAEAYKAEQNHLDRNRKQYSPLTFN